MSDLYDRAAAVLGTTPDGIRWPYGMSPAQRSYTRRDETPEEWAQRVEEKQARQEAMVSWAERYGLKYSPMGCCPPWLQRATSRRCRPYARTGERCTRYGTQTDHNWLDHAVGWLKDGKPAVLTSAPYNLEYITEAPKRLAYWQQQDDRLQVVTGPGWYPHSMTTQIIVWRVDRIAAVEPAVLPTVG